MRSNRFLILIVVITLIASCRRDDDAWKTNILAPIVKSELGLDDLISDEYLIVDDDSSYRLHFFDFINIDSFDDYLAVPDTVQEVTVTLQKLILDDKVFTDTITLKEIDPSTVIFHNQTVNLPAQEFQDSGDPQEIDVSEEFFSTAEFKSGFLDITIYNDLPVEVEIMEFQLSNKDDGSIIIRDTFQNIQPLSSASKSIDLSGKKVNGIMLAELLSVKTKASQGEVLVDVNKGVRVELKTRDLKPESATAVFPAQDLVTDTQEVVYDLGAASVTEMGIKSGKVIMEVFSTIEEEIVLDYTIPFSGLNGDFTKPIKRVFRVPPAPKGQTQVLKQEFPIDNYVVQYKGKDPSVPPFFNAVYSELIASIEYSGIERSISLSDSVYVRFGLVDVIPSYAIGDFGSRDIDIIDSIPIKIFENVRGAIDLEDIEMGLTIENRFGIESNITINSFKGNNTRTNTLVDLNNPDLLDNTVTIGRASNPPLTPYVQFWELNSTNSNIKPFVENLPNQIITDFNVVTRPNGSNDYTDWVFYESFIRARIDVKMPIKFGAQGLSLETTEPFDIRDIKNQERVSSGEFTLVVDNDFPLGADVTLTFMDDEGQELLTLFEGQKVSSAELISGKDSTSGPVQSRLKADISAQDMDLIRASTRIRINAVFDSPDSDRHAVYNSYRLKTRLIGNFEYEQQL